MVLPGNPFLRDRVVVFTTLLGHKSSLTSIKQLLNSKGVTSLTTTEFCQVSPISLEKNKHVG
jgi:hypothetical protein